MSDPDTPEFNKPEMFTVTGFDLPRRMALLPCR